MASGLEGKSQGRVFCDLLLVWDWNAGDSKDQQLFETVMKSRASEFVETEPSGHFKLESVERALGMVTVLEEVQEWFAVKLYPAQEDLDSDHTMD
ncbi:uncharacterized protein N7483_013132 [Penicillium malachiteum]|uniref:uncharacterized protein n=1 Tax=Penicillium malachiteum TaxID=1324776 RepID=UPI0025493709|nr:uncharacterized protein N7483_013132 [Penicillium malachiteum]KAJ5715951.1 hypothetical protein N7483_013132 [Penicillium malachiteum]